MRFYSHQHQFYCGIDLHARSMFLCIQDQSGEVLLHRNYRAVFCKIEFPKIAKRNSPLLQG